MLRKNTSPTYELQNLRDQGLNLSMQQNKPLRLSDYHCCAVARVLKKATLHYRDFMHSRKREGKKEYTYQHTHTHTSITNIGIDLFLEMSQAQKIRAKRHQGTKSCRSTARGHNARRDLRNVSRLPCNAIAGSRATRHHSLKPLHRCHGEQAKWHLSNEQLHQIAQHKGVRSQNCPPRTARQQSSAMGLSGAKHCDFSYPNIFARGALTEPADVGQEVWKTNSLPGQL